MEPVTRRPPEPWDDTWDPPWVRFILLPFSLGIFVMGFVMAFRWGPREWGTGLAFIVGGSVMSLRLLVRMGPRAKLVCYRIGVGCVLLYFAWDVLGRSVPALRSRG